MATTIITKNGSGAPTTDDLSTGELAIDLTNKRLYSYDGTSVIELGVNTASSLNVTGTVTADGLTVESSSDPTSITLRHTGNTSGFVIKNFSGAESQLVNVDNGPMVFKTNDTEAMRITSSLNVGIGGSPDTKLHLIDGGTPEFRLESTDTSVVSGQSLGDITWESNDVSGGGQGVRAKIHAEAENAGTIYGLVFSTGTGAAPTEKVRITNTGLVGIGTDSPSVLLDLESASPIIRLTDSDASGTPECQISGAGGDLILAADRDNEKSDSLIKFEVDGSEAMQIDSSGHLLINNTSFSSLGTIVVKQTADSKGIAIIDDTESNTFFIENQGDEIKFRGNTTSPMTFSHSTGETMRIDSSGNVHIGAGTASTANLSIITLGQAGGIQLNRNTSGSPTSGQSLGSYAFKGLDSANSNAAAEAMIEAVAAETHTGSTAATNMIFYTKGTGTGPGSAPTPRMTLDASGNLLVGVTSTTIPGIGNTTAGVSIRGDDGSFFSRSLGSGDTNNVVSINRSTADGPILGFQKDGTTVGIIGTEGGDMAIGNDDAGIQFVNGTEHFRPFNMTTNAATDALMDIGSGSKRFKDLYLSGGVVLDDNPTAVGGSVTSKTLDDYEEGTFTPTVVGSTTAGTATYSFQTGRYTKVGNLVTVQIYLNWSSGTGAGVLQFDGLPFTTKNATAEYASASIAEFSNITGTAGHMLCGVGLPNNTKIQFAENDFNSSPTTVSYDAAGYIVLSMTYIAD